MQAQRRPPLPTSEAVRLSFEPLKPPAKITVRPVRRLPPGDPDAVLGIQPIANVIETDTDYTMGQNDFCVICQGKITVTLADNPLTATPVIVVADSGPVNVVGGTRVIQGGNVTVKGGTFQLFSFSPLSGEWNVLGISPGAEDNNTVGEVDFASSPYTTRTTDVLVEVNDAGGQCQVILNSAPLINPITIKKTTTNQNSIQVSGGPNLVEDPQLPGTWAAVVFIQPAPPGATATTWTWTGSRWDLTGGF
jgi:hypothetical protein